MQSIFESMEQRIVEILVGDRVELRKLIEQRCRKGGDVEPMCQDIVSQIRGQNRTHTLEQKIDNLTQVLHQHIHGVESVFTQVKAPANFVKRQIERIMGNGGTRGDVIFHPSIPEVTSSSPPPFCPPCPPPSTTI